MSEALGSLVTMSILSVATRRSGVQARMSRSMAVVPVLALALAGVLAAPNGAGAQADPPAFGVAAASRVPWDERGTLVLSPAEALSALENLPPDSPAAVSWGEGGSRTGWFGRAWEDVDGDGCDTRNEILARDLTETDYSRAEGLQGREEGAGQGASVCPDATVWSGVLHDPYTGSTIAFTRGQDTSAAVQIDHVVPLNYLYAHGAWAWDARTRLLVANDPLNLLAVDGQANQSKGACGPATCPVGSTETGTWDTAAGAGWWPPQEAEHCRYAQRFVSVAAAYGLGLPDADRTALHATLSQCLTGDGSAPLLQRGGDLAARTASAVVHHPGRAVLACVGTILFGIGLMGRARRALGRGRRRRRR